MSLRKVCQGCLSGDRKLAPIGKHEQLYQQLLLTKSIGLTKIQLLFCWECKKILDSILEFRLKITQAQKLLNSTPMLQYDTLSNLTAVTKVDDYTIIIYKDTEKIPIDVQVEVIKDEKQELWEDDKLIDNIEATNTKPLEDIDLKEEVKNEEYDDIHFDDAEMIDDVVKKESDEDLIPINLLKTASQAKPKRKKRGVLKKKYRTIIMKDIPDKRKLYDKVIIDQKALEGWLETKRKQTSKKAFQCEHCYCGFSQQKFYDHHLDVRHSKRLGRFECDVCAFRFADMNKLAYHVRGHYLQFVCKLCRQAYRTRGEIYLHFTHGPHGRQRECKKCGLRFDCRLRREFFEHYKKMHEQFICDYCGKKYVSKKSLAIHIRKIHSDHRCDICNVSFASQESHVRHNKRKHVVDMTEHNYCVECNMQFINSTQYGEHLKSSVKHRANRAIPCPECDKVYTKRISMMNHYDLVHLKKSKYHCAICDTYYLNGYRLRYHQKYFHEKRPKVKNRFCKYCGKAFSNNRILENHMRTHTGERPFACARCPAAFAQKQALKTHVKSAHK